MYAQGVSCSPMNAVRPLVVALVTGCAAQPMTEDHVGDAEFCTDVATWPTEASNAEDALLDAVNEVRRVGTVCAGVVRPPALPLALASELRCASRAHARDLATTGRLSHTGRDGSTTLERIGAAGYEDFPRHELLAANFTRAQDVVDAWLASELHCDALLDPTLADAGPGARENAKGDSIAWVLTTGELRPE